MIYTLLYDGKIRRSWLKGDEKGKEDLDFFHRTQTFSVLLCPIFYKKKTTFSRTVNLCGHGI
jgi:hypothetical protein